VFAGHQVGGAIAAWGAGALHDSTGSYRPAFILAGACCLAAAVGVTRIRREALPLSAPAAGSGDHVPVRVEVHER